MVPFCYVVFTLLVGLSDAQQTAISSCIELGVCSKDPHCSVLVHLPGGLLGEELRPVWHICHHVRADRLLRGGRGCQGCFRCPDLGNCGGEVSHRGAGSPVEMNC